MPLGCVMRHVPFSVFLYTDILTLKCFSVIYGRNIGWQVSVLKLSYPDIHMHCCYGNDSPQSLGLLMQVVALIKGDL